jgi:hypothetical protein
MKTTYPEIPWPKSRPLWAGNFLLLSQYLNEDLPSMWLSNTLPKSLTPNHGKGDQLPHGRYLQVATRSISAQVRVRGKLSATKSVKQMPVHPSFWRRAIHSIFCLLQTFHLVQLWTHQAICQFPFVTFTTLCRSRQSGDIRTARCDASNQYGNQLHLPRNALKVRAPHIQFSHMHTCTT